jgi:hypothetical protein
LVKVTRIGGVLELWHEGTGNAFMVDIIPIDVAEVWMRLDFLRIRVAGSQTAFHIPRQQLPIST